MALTPDSLLALLETHEIPATTFTHPPVFTVEESKALRGDVPGVQTKNLFLRDNKRNVYLVVLAEDMAVNLKGLRGPLGAKGSLSFASPELLLEHLGVQSGAVSVLALANDTERHVTLAIETSLLQAEAIGCHPLTNERTTVLAPAALRAFLSVTGHEPVLLEPVAPEAGQEQPGHAPA